MPKRTHQRSKKKRANKHGFRARTKVLKKRRKKGRKELAKKASKQRK